jgi:hypothetical protein
MQYGWCLRTASPQKTGSPESAITHIASPPDLETPLGVQIFRFGGADTITLKTDVTITGVLKNLIDGNPTAGDHASGGSALII